MTHQIITRAVAEKMDRDTMANVWLALIESEAEQMTLQEAEDAVAVANAVLIQAQALAGNANVRLALVRRRENVPADATEFRLVQ